MGAGDDEESEPPFGPSPAMLRRWRRLLADEQEAARAYRELASRRSGEEREILLGLAAAEERHVAHWEGLLGEDVGRLRRGTPRTRLMTFLARHFGWVFVLALMQQAESRPVYDSDSDAPPAMAADERIHGEVVRGLAARGRARMSGTLRAAVFGANDGLVSNIALVLGVIGGGAGTQTVLLTGLSGLLAGALSMAAGEYISVSSQRELLAASTPDEAARASLPALDVDANELALVYRARGMPAEEARRHADAVLRREHSGPAPAVSGSEGADVVGSGIGAAGASFAFFGTGALVPVLPFLAGAEGLAAVVAAGLLTGVALMLTGGVVGVLSGAPPLRRALRQFAIGAAAAALTYLLGLAFGATLG
ncbi:VIT1/CCC1 family predicted Fe2+/Mn2+ transporter [Spinactinospora alkalitolerans]|uniref:VIT1/CCC1 family predicted Fe2+/Mn2+ transporter n=1 Tax=Spinactinospora alkalitolerans TaxID=687207 RepID=A0A852TW10_9ACTN|nr:VIT1/CCC1 transporter family protein [Spinactinospora alkalitolerans]NYE47033.1 VIT1/CCC1 family predicted Fe2+/Mn2+ transporter [Spinactinospora alkalitolerans]